ncbi:MAG TPA: TRAP transporter large permease [Polyangiaceae bacterium]
MVIILIVLIFALAGAPIFTVMAGATGLAWLTHENPDMRFVRFLAPDVLDERFAGSPILITVPLFTFVGYVMAESKAPERIVRAADAFFGWLPGGLPIVCIIASAFFSTLTGGSAVTIVAVGGLLYPALVRSGYPQDYSLGVIMTGGSLGLLLPPSVPILIYSLVAGIDFQQAFKAGIVPGLFMISLLALHAMYVGVKYKVPRSRPRFVEMVGALWSVKWELFLPVVVLGSLAIGLANIDESAALAAAYVLAIEIYVHKDIKFKDMPRLASNSMALAGALLLIMAMAMGLTNYLISEQVPDKMFKAVTSMGITERWHFLVARNFFMYVIGAVMEGFSAILVAVPLLLPFGAEFTLSPFHLAVMFLLDLEIAFLSPPFGQNLFVASFRFKKPLTSLYRVALPFLGIMFAGLTVIMFVPRLSTIMVEPEIKRLRALAAARNEPPRDAWLLECVQEDRNNPLPCSDEDKKKWGAGQDIGPGGADDPENVAKTEEDYLKQLLEGEGEQPASAGDDVNPEAAGEKAEPGKEPARDEKAKKDGDEP